MKELLEAASKSLFKELRDLALKKGTETIVSEGLKSVIEIVKRRRLRMDEYEFAEWKKEQNPEDEEKEKSKSKKSDESKSKDSDTPDEAEKDESSEESDEPEAQKPAPKVPKPGTPKPPDEEE